MFNGRAHCPTTRTRIARPERTEGKMTARKARQTNPATHNLGKQRKRFGKFVRLGCQRGDVVPFWLAQGVCPG